MVDDKCFTCTSFRIVIPYVIEKDGDYCLTFYRHMFGYHIGALQVHTSQILLHDNVYLKHEEHTLDNDIHVGLYGLCYICCVADIYCEDEYWRYHSVEFKGTTRSVMAATTRGPSLTRG